MGLASSFRVFAHAAYELALALDQANYNCAEKYPFTEDFGELVCKIYEWVEYHIENLV